MKRMSTTANSGCPAIPTKKQKMAKRADLGSDRLPEVASLKMTTEDMTKTFRDWTVLCAEYFYPEVGTKTYRVPAFYFNHQNLLTPVQAAKKNLASLPCASSSSSRSSSSASSCSSSSSSFLSPSSSVSASSHSSFSSGFILNKDLRAVHDKVCTDIGKSAASISDELLQSSTDVADNSLVSRPPDGEERTGLGRIHPFSDDKKDHDNVEQVVGTDGLSAASTLPKSSPSPSSDGTTVSFCNGLCSEPLLGREFSVNTDESRNLKDDTKCNVQKISCFGSVNEVDDDDKHRSESTVSFTLLKSKTKRRHSAQKRVQEFNTMQNSDDFQDNDRSNKQETPFSSQEELSICQQDGSEHRKDSSAVLHPPGDKNTRRQSSSASRMLVDTHSSPEETQNSKVISSKPASKTRSSQQPVQLICPPQESMMRRDKAMTVVLDSFETLGKELEQEGRNGLFIISGVNYDNYLNRIPVHVLRECHGGYLGDSHVCRGVLDVLILQEHVGMVLVQVKSVGGNKAEWQASDREMVAALRKVLKKAKARSQRLRDDLSKELIPHSGSQEQTADSLTTFHVLALPFIPRRLYHKTLEDDSLADQVHDRFQLKVLCKEDFESSGTLGGPMETSVDSSSRAYPPWVPPRASLSLSARRSPLFVWWTSTFIRTETRLSQHIIKEIVGRLCGIFSTLTVLPDTKYRAEVRTFGHSVSETAARYSAPCLTNVQYDVLQCADRFVALSGPPGSGKSLMLTLKAVQWLELGEHNEDHVVVATIGGRTAVTPAHVRVLQERINERRTGNGTGGHLLRVTYPLDKTPLENIEREVAASVAPLMRRVREARATTDDEKDEAAGVPECGIRQTANRTASDKLHFVLNDVDPDDEKTQRVLRALREHPLVHSVWWSTSEPPRTQGAWSLFRVVELKDVTRRSPHVQHVLKRLEWRDKWRDSYAASSVESGLPTEGPPVVYVQHQQHLQEIRQSYSRVHTGTEQRRQILSQHLIQERSGNPQQCQKGGDHEQDSTLDHAKLFSQQQDQQGLNQSQRHTRDHYDVSRVGETTLNNGRTLERVQDQDTLQDLQNPIFDVCEIQSGPSEEGVALHTASDNSNSVSQQGGQSVGGKFHSPFWCSLCAETVADIVSYLVTDSTNPKLSPFFLGDTKLLKDPSKNKFGVPVKPRDILIMTTFPQQKNGHATSQEEVKRCMKDLMHSTLVLRVQNEVPLKVLSEEAGGKIAFPRNSAVLTDARGARGLERKVVIYVPCSLQNALFESSVPDNATETNPRAALHEGPLYSIPGNSLGAQAHPLPMCRRMDTSEDVSLEIKNLPTEPLWTEKLSTDYLTFNEGNDDLLVALSPVCNETNMSRPTHGREAGQTTADCLMFIEDANDNSVDHSMLDGETEERTTSLSEPSAGGQLSEDDQSQESSSFDELYEGSLDSFDVCNASDIGEDGEPSPRTVELYRSSSDEITSEPNSGEFNTDTAALKYQDFDLTPTQLTTAPEFDEGNADKNGEVDSSHLPTPHDQDSALAATTKEELPSWMKDKKRTSRPKLKSPVRLLEQHAKQKPNLANFQRAETADRVLRDKKETETSSSGDLDNLLSGLNDDDRRGLYVAASCCLAQLVVVIP